MSQERYQVRFEWGDAGVRRIAAGTHVVVVADELDGHGRASAAQLAAAIAETVGDGPAVLCVTEASSQAAAAWILRLQESVGDRAIVAVVGAGSIDDDGYRFAVEDHFAAGAVIDALASVGIDFSSPEAAAACASFTKLRRATGHLLTASVSATGGAQDPAGQRAAHPAVVTVLREFSPPA
ncbi:MAG: hypothetical protein JWP75_2972 [Frondihabitans sp.]|nr:hypothetical protein [Frondihabitans sp.]